MPYNCSVEESFKKFLDPMQMTSKRYWYLPSPKIHLWSNFYEDPIRYSVVFSERELMFMFAICRRPSVCLSSIVCLSVTFVHPTQAIEIFRNVSTPFGTLAICDPSIKILRRSSQGTPPSGVKPKRGKKIGDFGPFQSYISETVQDRR